MIDNMHDDELQALWQSQPPGEVSMSMDRIQTLAAQLENRVARRNRREFVAIGIAVVLFAWLAWLGPSMLQRVGAALTIAYVLFTAHQLRRRAGASPLPADLALTQARDFYRDQLSRQRDLLRGVWAWGLLPALPGLFFYQLGQARARPDRPTGTIAVTVFALAVLLAVHALNLRVASRIQERIDRL